MQIQSVLVVGCGLIGTSLAMALKRANENLDVEGVDSDPLHQQEAMNTGVFGHVYGVIPAQSYDLAILAVPVDASISLLPVVAQRARWMMDVCSVKVPLTTEAVRLGLQQRFAPTHPMSGKVNAGPAAASADLFAGNTWILTEGWPVCDKIRPLLESVGARPAMIASPEGHDEVMARVSHMVQLASMSVMLAVSGGLQADWPDWARFTGPGFRDTTRLSASQAEFWLSTLLQNRENVAAALKTCRSFLNDFEQAIESGDARRLHELMHAAQAAHADWEGARICSQTTPYKPIL